MPETALVIVNMQKARTSKNSDYYLGNLAPSIKKLNYLIAYAREMNYKIIFIQHLEETGAFSENNQLAQLLDELDFQANNDTVLQKHKISAYFQTSLDQELEGIKNIVVCGALTNLCLRMFVEESYDRGYRIALIEDLCFAFSDEIQEHTLEDLYTTRAGLNILPLERFVA